MCNHQENCSHNHSEDKETIIVIVRIIISIIIAVFGVILSCNILFGISLLIIAYDVIFNAIKSLFSKMILNECLLMSIASIGAFVLGEHLEAIAVMLFYQIGELFCDRAEDKTKKSLKELIDIKPDYANLFINNSINKVKPEDLQIDDIIVVSVGEKVPCECEIIEGKSQFDTSKMTGEGAFQYLKVGDTVIGGSINCGKLVKLKVIKNYENSSVAKVSKLLEEIENNKSNHEKFLDTFAKYYTPIVVILALFTAILPPILLNEEFSKWTIRALMFLVVSCPCALVISVPIAFFSANGCASKSGIMIKGSSSIEKLSKIKTIAFDKTGTLTKGSFKINSIRCNGEKLKVLELLAYAEYYSTHPIAQVIVNEYLNLGVDEIDTSKIKNYTEIAGMGINVLIDGQNVLVGNEKLLESNNIDFQKYSGDFTASYLTINNKYIGYIEFSDGIKEEAQNSIKLLQKLGVRSCILSGDREEIVSEVSKNLGVSKYFSKLMPEDKVKIVNELKNDGFVAFCGDGINDAPVILSSDVGISMGTEGTGAAIEASDVVILSDDIEKIPLAVKISRKTMRIVFFNIVFALIIKLLILILSFLGISNMWFAVFADVGVSVLCVLNSIRCFNYVEE